MQYNLAIIYNAQTGDITINVLRYDVVAQLLLHQQQQI